MTQFSWLVISIVAGIVGLGVGFLLGAAIYPDDEDRDDE